MPEHVSLALFDPLRNERRDVDINARLTSVQISTATAKGFDQLQIGMRPITNADGKLVSYGQLPEPLDTRPFSHCELRIGGFLAFEGRLMPTTVPVTGLVARGYWETLSQDDWFSSTDTTLDSSGNVIRSMLSGSIMLVRPGGADQFNDPQTQHAPREFDGRTVADALMQIVGEGDSLSNPLDWYVWEDKRLWLLSRTPPTTPDYAFDIKPGVVDVISDPSEMFSSLVVEYTISANGTATIASGTTSIAVSHGLGVTPPTSRIRFFMTNNPTSDPGTPYLTNVGASTFTINVRNDPGASGASFTWFAEAPGQRTDEASKPDFEQQFGFRRRRKLGAGTMTKAAAERIRDRLMIEATRPRYKAKVGLGTDQRLLGPRGEPLAKWTARAGRWAAVADLPLLICVSSRYDAMTDTLDMDLGERYPSFGETLRLLQLAEERRGRGIDPATGGGLIT